MKLNIGPESAPEQGLFNAYERKRMIMLCGLLLVIGTVFIVSLNKEQDRREHGTAPTTEGPITVTSTPKIDVDAYRKLVDDSTPEARVLVAQRALEKAFEDARLLSPKHFEPMGGRDLDRATTEHLLAEPDAERGQIFRARGSLDEIESFDSAGSTAHYRGRLRLDDGAYVYFAAISLKDLRGEVGEYGAIEGLFLENYRRQARREPGASGPGKGGWIDAPLIVGPRLMLSFPELEPVTKLEPMAFADVRDDSVESITGQPFHEYWNLVSYVQQLDDESFDWSAAPLLNEKLYGELRENGAAWRAKPLRIPPSELMDIWDQSQKENPVRVASLAEGWIGNWDWMKTGSGVLRFVGTFDASQLSRNDIVEARGFFLKQSAYEMRDGGIGIAPILVLHSMEGFTPQEDNSWTIILALIGGSLLVFAAIVGLALLRDRKKARSLQAELRRRRQARRAQPQA